LALIAFIKGGGLQSQPLRLAALDLSTKRPRPAAERARAAARCIRAASLLSNEPEHARALRILAVVLAATPGVDQTSLVDGAALSVANMLRTFVSTMCSAIGVFVDNFVKLRGAREGALLFVGTDESAGGKNDAQSVTVCARDDRYVCGHDMSVQ
jgi:hypothetical protein